MSQNQTGKKHTKLLFLIPCIIAVLFCIVLFGYRSFAQSHYATRINSHAKTAAYLLESIQADTGILSDGTALCTADSQGLTLTASGQSSVFPWESFGESGNPFGGKMYFVVRIENHEVTKVAASESELTDASVLDRARPYLDEVQMSLAEFWLNRYIGYVSFTNLKTETAR